MLQPTDWAATPESLLGGIPEQRRKLYELVWNSSLACTFKAPLIQHTRFIFKANGTTFVIANVQASKERAGYWNCATDYPHWWFPVERAMPTFDALNIKKTWLQKYETLTMGRLIRTMSHLGIGTAASTAKMLEDAFGAEENKYTAMLEFGSNQPGQPSIVSITQYAKSRLERWKPHHLIGKTAVTNAVVQAVEDGKYGYRAALTLLSRMDRGDAGDAARHLEANAGSEYGVIFTDQLNLVGDSRYPFPAQAQRINDSKATKDSHSIFKSIDNEDAATQAALFIDAICLQWAGISREESSQTADVKRIVPPQHPGLPEWLDPEIKLPANHPLRVLRQKMEEALVIENRHWENLDNSQKADLRVSWLLSHRDLHPDLGRLFNGPDTDFSALKYWLTGKT